MDKTIDVETLENLDGSLYQYLKQTGVKATYAVAIKNTKTDNVIGFLVADYLSREDVNIEQIQHCLNDKKLKIEALLNL